LFFSSYSRIKRILDQSTSQGDERGVPRIGSIGGAKTRDSAQRFTRHGAGKKGQDQVTYSGGVPATVSAFVQRSPFYVWDVHALVQY
jgi:hypothetical protein